MVNQTYVSQIIEFGFPREVAEKALLFTGNQTVEKAMDWIEQHQNDEDFYKEERILETSSHDPSKPKLSKEEQLKILQEKIELNRKLKAEQAIKDEEE